MKNSISSLELDIKEYTLLLETISEGMVIFYLHGDKLITKYVNSALLRLTEYSEEEYYRLYEKDASQLVYAEDKIYLRIQMTKNIWSEEVLELSFRINTKYGQVKWVNANIAQYKEVEGEIIWRAILSDVSMEKEQEMKLDNVYNQLLYRINHDELTGLYNRDHFYQATEKMLREKKNCSFDILRLNIEKFQLINDQYGEKAGDFVLCNVADLIKSRIEKLGTYGRLANDHFVMCIPRKTDKVQESHGELNLKLKYGGIDIIVSFTLGIYKVTDISMPIILMCDRANIALNSLQETHLKRIAVYRPEMMAEILNEQKTTRDVFEALENGEFEVFYQPIYAVRENRFSSAEALARWIKKDGSIVSPIEFIPVLEKTGFILELDRYIWERVCMQLRSWIDEGIEPIPVSVNASALHIMDPAFVDVFLSLLEKYNIAPSLIRLELTESTYAADAQTVQNIVGKLQSAGILILMDDFGSEYSSFNMLKDVNVDVIKIDKRFMSNFDDGDKTKSILTSIIMMAKLINLSSIVEGVETEAQATFLRSIGSTHIQGYYYSRPMSPVDFKTLLTKDKSITHTNKKIEEITELDIAKIMDSNPILDLLWNSTIVGSGFYEYQDKHIRVFRANDYYYEMMFKGNILNEIEQSDRVRFIETLDRACASGRVEENRVNRILADNRRCMLYFKVKYIGNIGEKKIIAFAIINGDISAEMEEEWAINLFGGIVKDIFRVVLKINTKKDTLAFVSNGSTISKDLEQGSVDDAIKYCGEHYIHPMDRVKYHKFFNLYNIENWYKTSKNSYRTEFRVLRSSGRFMWIECIVFLISRDTYLVCVLDIEDRKTIETLKTKEEQQEKQKWQDERYRILVESSNAITFDYDVVSDIMTVNYNDEIKGFRENAVVNYLSKGKARDQVRWDFVTKYLGLFKNARKASICGTMEVIMKNLRGNYRWCRIYYISVTDDMDRVYRIVGRIDDIQEEKEKQKRKELEKLALMRKAQFDQVTGLFNRSATEEAIDAELADREKGRIDVFAVYDLDNFKRFNDKFGHPIGDKLLNNIGKAVKSICRSSDIVGRIGGDEFAIYLKDIPGKETALKRIQQCCMKVEQVNLDMNIEEEDFTTISIGVIFPCEQDTCFKDLFEKADKLLYEAKFGGKNQFRVYQE